MKQRRPVASARLTPPVIARLGVSLAVSLAVFGGGALSAASLSDYAAYTVAAGSGTATFDSALSFPDATFAVGPGSVSRASGTGTWLSRSTPFGGVFGSSRNLPYLVFSVPRAGSSVTFTFESPTPVQSGGAGWGFAIGDVDAENVRISATGPGGPLSAADLGWQGDDGAFNYCAVSPRPSACRAGSGDDLPNWSASTSTLRGNNTSPAPDTDGASGWFRPNVPVTSLTLTGEVIAGIPSFQFWIAALDEVGISGRVDAVGTVDPGPVSGVELQLLDGAGSPVVVDGSSVTTMTGRNGTYRFGDLDPGAYRVQMFPPIGAVVVGADVIDVTITSGEVSGVDFTVELPPGYEPPEPVIHGGGGSGPKDDLLPETGLDGRWSLMLAALAVTFGSAAFARLRGSGRQS